MSNIPQTIGTKILDKLYDGIHKPDQYLWEHTSLSDSMVLWDPPPQAYNAWHSVQNRLPSYDEDVCTQRVDLTTHLWISSYNIPHCHWLRD